MIRLTAAHLQEIILYHNKKGKMLPVVPAHYIYVLANKKRLDANEVLQMFPGSAGMFLVRTLSLVKWNPANCEMLKEKICKNSLKFQSIISYIILPK